VTRHGSLHLSAENTLDSIGSRDKRELVIIPGLYMSILNSQRATSMQHSWKKIARLAWHQPPCNTIFTTLPKPFPFIRERHILNRVQMAILSCPSSSLVTSLRQLYNSCTSRNFTTVLARYRDPFGNTGKPISTTEGSLHIPPENFPFHNSKAFTRDVLALL